MMYTDDFSAPENKLSFQEKGALIYILSNTLIFSMLAIYISRRYQAGFETIIDEFSFWGLTMLLLIPIHIAITIVLRIALSIFNAVTTDEKEAFFTDEFDKLIELKALRTSYFVFMAGFLLAMAALAFGMPPIAMLVIIAISLYVAQIADALTQIYFYRKGF